MSEAAYPTYLTLARTGELERRAADAVAALAACQCCPRRCGADRLHGKFGQCRIGRHARVASCHAHHGEEACLRGWNGSGTIFLSGCSLLCVFCQNYDLSHECEGRPVPAARLAEMMLELQAEGCHNINWVTPSHVAPQLLEALALAASQGLRLPVVYNSSGYDCLDTLRRIEGVVDIYMPDFKFWAPAVAERLAHASDYPVVAREAIREMHRQVGDLVLDRDGLARRGLLLRHLVMPNGLAGTRSLAQWLARDISPHTYVNLMAQYHPDGDVVRPESGERFRDLARPITSAEYGEALKEVKDAGLYRCDHGGE